MEAARPNTSTKSSSQRSTCRFIVELSRISSPCMNMRLSYVPSNLTSIPILFPHRFVSKPATVLGIELLDEAVLRPVAVDDDCYVLSLVELERLLAAHDGISDLVPLAVQS